MSAPIIFLDVDGVLVHSGTIDLGKQTGEAFGTSFYHAATVDLACVQRVLRIVEATGAKIVVSSVWRRFDGQSTALRRAFLSVGVERRELRKLLVGSTPHLGEKRDEEVSAWLKEHPEVARYLVIDDDIIGTHPQLTDRPNQFADGLLDSHVEEAIRILGASEAASVS